MSMLPDENTEGELNADEQDSLQVGEEMQQEQETMLAGKYKNAEELEAAYIELQKKLGATDADEETTESTEEEDKGEEEETSENTLFDKLWEESQSEFKEETLTELRNSKPEDLAKMYLEYRTNTPTKTISEKDAGSLKNSVGGEQIYNQMLQWAGKNLNESEISMYDSVMDSGDRNAAFFAMQTLAMRYNSNINNEGKLIQGKAPSNQRKGFRSQAEVVSAMQDPRYDRDPAYRQMVMSKLESSNVNF